MLRTVLEEHLVNGDALNGIRRVPDELAVLIEYR